MRTEERGGLSPNGAAERKNHPSPRVLCSTGALIGRTNGRDYRLLAPCAEKLRCDGFELMMYDTWYADVDGLSRFLLPLSLQIPVLHCEKRIGEMLSAGGEENRMEASRRFEINCQLASVLGADRMVMHLWDGVTSDHFFSNNLAAYIPLRDLARRYGVTLTIENVVCAQADPLTRLRQLLAVDPEALLTYDIKMAAFHGQTEKMYQPENRDLWPRIAHLHVNDFGGAPGDWSSLKTLHLGRGSIDFSRLFAFLNTVGYEGDYTVEATAFLPDGVIHWEDLNRDFAIIRGFL